MKVKEIRPSRKIRSIARKALVKSGLNVNPKREHSEIILTVKRSYKTFKVGINKCISK